MRIRHVVAAGLTAGVLMGMPGAALAQTTVQVTETSGDQTELLAAQPAPAFSAGSGPSGLPTISVDDTQHFQQMAGFGAAMTDSSAFVLMHDMTSTQRAATMTQLFDPTSGIGLDYVRVPIGANDFSTANSFSSANYTEDDVPAGKTDQRLRQFTIGHDLVNLVPVLQQALAINPKIQILATPWSAPAWMKTSGTVDGGTLNSADNSAYAAYLVKFVQAYAAQGIPISALTMQNEPDDNETGYPGMTLTAQQEETLAPILGRDLSAAGLSTQIIGFDSDWSDASYATTLLANSSAAKYLAGTAFHCYAGDPSAQLAVESAAPSKGIYDTECSGYNGYPSFSGNLVSGTETLVINAVRDWSKSVMLWNMVLDQDFGPQNGGCPDCIPNVSVDNVTGAATDNVEYYLLGQVSKFVAPGAYRISSTDLGQGSIETVAFQNPDNTDVLLALNDSGAAQTFVVRWDGDFFTYAIPSGAVQTLVWPSGGGAAAPAAECSVAADGACDGM